jgi:hypothetical protein
VPAKVRNVRFGSKAERLEPSISCPLFTRQVARADIPDSQLGAINRHFLARRPVIVERCVRLALPK